MTREAPVDVVAVVAVETVVVGVEATAGGGEGDGAGSGITKESGRRRGSDRDDLAISMSSV